MQTIVNGPTHVGTTIGANVHTYVDNTVLKMYIVGCRLKQCKRCILSDRVATKVQCSASLKLAPLNVRL